MARFMITLDDGDKLVWHAFEDMVGGEIYVKKIPSMNIMDIADAIAPNAKKDFIGIRPGEKIHEKMISVEDSLTTYEYEDYFKILPAINNWCDDENRIKLGDKVPNGFEYDSGTNQETMSKKELISWIKENMEHLGKI